MKDLTHTVYALDNRPGERNIVAIWPERQLLRCETIIPSVNHPDATRLCQAMTKLSKALWGTYGSIPPCAKQHCEHEEQVETFAETSVGQRCREIGSRQQLVAALRNPDQVCPGDSVLLDAACAVGALLAAGPPRVARSITTNFVKEVEALQLAERGQFEGRSSQAQLASVEHPILQQVIEAHELIAAGKMHLLRSRVNLTAAAVAFTQWLVAALALTEEIAAHHLSDATTEHEAGGTDRYSSRGPVPGDDLLSSLVFPAEVNKILELINIGVDVVDVIAVALLTSFAGRTQLSEHGALYPTRRSPELLVMFDDAMSEGMTPDGVTPDGVTPSGKERSDRFDGEPIVGDWLLDQFTDLQLTMLGSRLVSDAADLLELLFDSYKQLETAVTAIEFEGQPAAERGQNEWFFSQVRDRVIAGTPLDR